MSGTFPSSDPAEGIVQHEFVILDQTAVAQSVMLPNEVALALSYNGIAYGVMMVSPVALEDFAIGFSLSSGLLAKRQEIYELHITGAGDRWQADFEVSSRAFWYLKKQRRILAGTSGCGLCGVEALNQALPELPTLPTAVMPPGTAFVGLRERITKSQSLGQSSGAVHAALYVNFAGDILLCREDIGRHNALDKLIGALTNHDATPGFVVITSRCSLELIQKAVRVGISTLVTLSAPTSTSVEWARIHKLNLIHLPRKESPRVFSSAEVFSKRN